MPIHLLETEVRERMDILIGKHGNQPFQLTDSTISRQHAVLHVEPNGQLILRDNNSLNGTWIKMNDGSFKRLSGEVLVRPETTIRLGAKFICTIQQILKKPEAPPVNIKHLRGCYDTYMENKMSFEAKSSNIMMLRMASMSLGTVIGLLIATILPKDFLGNEMVGIIAKGVATLISIGIAWLIVDIMNKKLIRQKKENEESFKRNYRCPKCSYHFGPKVYSNLLAEGKCPNNNCRCKFVEN